MNKTIANSSKLLAVFVLVMVLALVVVMVFPPVATWLPDYVYNKP